MKILNYLYLLGLFLILNACQGDKQLFLGNNTHLVVLNSLLVAHETPLVYVGKTWSVTDSKPSKTYYENAIVELWENQNLIGVLSFNQTLGQYEFPNYTIQPNKVYTLKAFVEGHEKVESKPIRIPADVQVKSISTRFLSSNEPININRTFRQPISIKATLENNTNSGDYMVLDAESLLINSTDTLYGSAAYPTEIDPNNTLGFEKNPCYAEAPTLLPPFSSRYALAYNTQCLGASSKEIELVADGYTLFYDKNVKNSSFNNANAIRVLSAIYLPDYILFRRADRVVEGSDNAFVPTQPTYSNVKGGIGIVTAINRKIQIVKL